MIRKTIIYFICITLSIMSGMTALSAIAKKQDPEISLSLSPTNGFAAEESVTQHVTAAVTKGQGRFPDGIDANIYELALIAFKSEPVTPGAIAAIASAKTGNSRRALMQKAFSLSRRQKLVIGWMVADASTRNDVPGVLKYYDMMLQISPSTSPLIIPTMANALTNEEFIKPLAAILSQRPVWSGAFWSQVAVTPAALSNAKVLRQLLHQPDERNDVYRDGELIQALVGNLQFDKAEQLHTLLSEPPQIADLILDPDFRLEPRLPPIDWQLVSTGEYGAVIKNEKLVLSAIGNSGGLFARQLVKLPSEVLMLSLKFVSKPPKDSELFLQMSCAEDILNKPNTIRIPLTEISVTKDISNRGSGCSYYWLDVMGRSADNGNGFDIAIESISLHGK